MDRGDRPPRVPQRPGTPRNSTVPRSSKPVPEPTTRSRTVRETRISLGLAANRATEAFRQVGSDLIKAVQHRPPLLITGRDRAFRRGDMSVNSTVRRARCVCADVAWLPVGNSPMAVRILAGSVYQRPRSSGRVVANIMLAGRASLTLRRAARVKLAVS
ncbi:hypothetical protein I552_6037 [Mycobacterium xenopi 3993]|nr:hypothetical protein I552_6037 [Mycobacterium xenopi 3993]